MPKRSLAEQVDRAIGKMLSGTREDARAYIPEDARAYTKIGAELRDLPREHFKANLKKELQRSTSMTTTVEAPAVVRTSATPRLAFKNAAKAIEFYKKAFGAKETFRFEIEQGVAHAEMMIGDSVIMFAEEWPEGGRYSAETWGHSPVSMQVSVPDVDAFVEHAVATGAKLIRPVSDQFYGYRTGTLLDPFGYTWDINTVKEEMSVDEMHRRFREAMPPKPKPAVDPVPKGYRTLTPYMVARDGDKLIEFVKQAFGAEETFRAIGSAGGIHAEVRIGDSMLMMGGGIPGREFKGAPNTTALHMYVKDVDATYKRALQEGATSIDEPVDQPYGERGASVTDPAGNYWYLATYKGENYKWEGAPDIQPYLHPLRAEPVINFLKRAFGAVELSRYASPDGVIHHATLKVGDSHLEMGEAHGKYQPLQSMFYLYVPDCDAVYERALQAGATSLAKPTDHDYGDRSGGVTDPFGNQWYIATLIKDV